MSEAEIQFVVEDGINHQDDVEDLLDAISGYQDRLPFHVLHTAEIAESEEGAYILKFIRTFRDQLLPDELIDLEAIMRLGVEGHLPQNTQNNE